MECGESTIKNDFVNDHVLKVFESLKVSKNDIHFIYFLEKYLIDRKAKYLEMSLPFKRRQLMPDYRMYAMRRLENLKKKLKRNKVITSTYVRMNFLKKIFVRGDVKLVESSGLDGFRWYIIPHGLYYAKNPDKVRIVFDCSSSYKGTLLNQHLLNEPDLINVLFCILIQFRRYPIAIICDFEKMFHQFIVS